MKISLDAKIHSKTVLGKAKDRALKYFELYPIWERLKPPAEESKIQFTDCVNTESAFRSIQ